MTRTGGDAVPNAAGDKVVAPCRVTAHAHASDHEQATQAAIGRRLAALLERTFVAAPARGASARGEVYWVPNDTIVGHRAARRLGIRDRFDLYGGVVPHAFVATKAITHPLVHDDSAAPTGWSHTFARRVDDGTLEGFSAFTLDDARRAGRRLLAHGPVRIKPVTGTGGHGQHVTADADELDRLLAALASSALDPGPDLSGVVLEQDLQELATFSVGQLELPGLLATYIGTQHGTLDNTGDTSYGGSTLDVARGGFDALVARPLSADARAALDRARAYDVAAHACFAGFFASRRNYDVVVGLDALGRRCCGVLEQSWRVGGASPAELTALAALRADPALEFVRAGCAEVFGPQAVAPPGADVYYQGVDAQAGPLLKYAWSEPHDGSR
jgi:hypothetical protein